MSAREWPCLECPATGKDFADLIGVVPSVVSAHLKAGRMTRGETLRRWLLEYCDHLRKVAGGHLSSVSTQEALARARIRESEAKAAKAEVETGKELAALVYVADLEPALRDWAAHGAQAIDAAIGRIVDAIESDFSIELEDRHVRHPLHATLRDLAAYPGRADGNARPGRGRVRAARTGADG